MSRPFRLILLAFLLFHAIWQPAAAQDSLLYNKQWQQVDSYIRKGLPQSALAQVRQIFTMARKGKQDAQVIRALVYMTGLQEETREENATASIKEFRQALPLLSNPSRAILNSMIASLYWRYYQQNRWKIYSRTAVAGGPGGDLDTWTAADFHKRIGDLYLTSLDDIKLLERTRLSAYDAILVRGNVRHLRPTLFDLLAHTALEYFANDESDLTRPAYAFEMNDPRLFSPAREFTRLTIHTSDSLSLHARALVIYQELLAFHLDDPNPDALLDADLARLQFVRQYAVGADADSLYLQALNYLTSRYGILPAASQAWYLLASAYNTRGLSYDPWGDTTHRLDRVLARRICEQVLQQKDSSEGKLNCFNLLSEITRPEMKFQLEQVNLPGQPFRVLVTYRNLETLYLRVLPATKSLREAMESGRFDSSLWNRLARASPVRSWQQRLPTTGDHQTHRTEIKVDGLPGGEYVLVASDRQGPYQSANTLEGCQLFYVSNISYVNEGNRYFLLHRSSGRPLAGATVSVWNQVYDNQNRRYAYKLVSRFTADTKGYLEIRDTSTRPAGSFQNYRVEVQWEQDHLFLQQPIYRYLGVTGRPESPDTSGELRIFYFTDRSIYRPGQTVYFKGIALIKQPNGNSRVNAGLTTRVYLENANGEDVDSVQVHTSDFGSFSGKFQLPSNQLTGNFRIWDRQSDDEASISVEEYKRPRFYVDYEPVRAEVRIYDSVHVTGTARAYAGQAVDQARVRYRVVRQPRFIYPWLLSRGWYPKGGPQELAHGETTTDATGHFEIRFRALPDLSIDSKLDPLFDYRVYADVTDVNGETRSGETTVQAGYHRLVVKLNLAGSLPCDSFRSVPVRTETVNGQFQPSRIHLVITRLKTENRLIRPRYWERPDQFVMTRQDYLSWFPHDEYDGESDMNTWAADSVVLDRYDSLSHESGLTLDRTLVRNRPFAAGYYRVEVTTLDRDGSLIANRQFLELYDPRTSALTRPAYLWSQDAAATEPGRTVALRVGTAASDCYIIQEIQRPHDSSASLSYLPFDHQVRDIPFSPTEQDRGGIPVRYFMVRDNRFFQVAGLVPVPWTNKELQLEVGTFRDKMLPGSQETWNLTIRGPKKEWVAAEMLASMYDASLDQFKFHAWTLPPVWETSSSSPAWEGTRCFSPSESLGNPFGGTTEKILQKQYDELILHMQRENPLIAIYGYRSMENALEGRVAGISVVTVKKELAGAVTKFTSQDSTQSAGAGQQDTGQPAPIQIRRDFKETAFFFPDLHTDSSGNIRFSFTMPEATTRWKFQALAHTRDLALGYTNLSVVTQKQLMVQPNAPRFLREGDRIEFSAKIVNLTDKELTGQAELQLFDAATNQPVDGWFQNMYAHQYFTVAAGQSEPVQFAIEVPYLFNKALTWRILARAGDFSDGEEASIPVLTSKVLVTESLPLSMMGSGTKKYTFTNLLHSGESESLQHFALTVEYSANPAWYALQALPYLIEFPQECAEQTWNRYYANALGTSLLSRMPRLREILDRWKGIDSTELLSNLQKNEELKSVLLQETPWVLQARDEAQQKKNLALLMDLNRMQPELGRNLERLRQLQTPNGGFTWFAGGPDDRYITQYIVSGMGHLRKLQAVTASQWQQIITLLKPALTYLDQRLAEDYAQRQKRPGVRQGPPALLQVQYLYARSFFPDIPISAPARKALDYFYSLARTSWVTQNKFLQGMIALAAFRKGDTQTAAAILQSLRQTAIRSEDLGMYWKAGSAGWYWYEAPIERQALLIEAFQEAGKDPVTADLLRHWLLSNKQTNQWSSTRATADACYSLLLSGSDWLPRSPAVEVQLGPAVVSSDTGQPDAGSSYFKKTIQGQFISPEMGQITLRVREAEPQKDTAVSPRKLPAAGPSWGAVYWQYFEDMDRVKAAVSPLQVKKSLYIVRNSDRGPVLTPLEEGETLHLGDKVTVRIELRADRDMEYVQMKDFRASSLEPIHVLSGYQWQGGLGYYEATRDASTNFFFDRLPRGSYVFEYTLFATQKGNFSNGITTVQCMYAPEFGAHSSGIRIQVE